MSIEPLQPVLVAHLFPEERAALLRLLGGLTNAQWHVPTPCPGWSVKDIAVHLMGDDLAGLLSYKRDHYLDPSFLPAGNRQATFPEIVVELNRNNELWVAAMRRLSTRVIVDLLRWTGVEVAAYLETLDPMALGDRVSWVGPEPAPVWLDVAREYTERWLHQQHVREAVGAPALDGRHWLGPVLQTFVRSVPRAYAGVSSPDGKRIGLTITGEAGGTWSLERVTGSWQLGQWTDGTADASVTIDQQTAWRLFTKGVAIEQARARARIDGDAALAAPLFAAVAIIA